MRSDLQPNSIRSQQARFGHFLSAKWVRAALVLMVITLLASGALAMGSGSSFGWLVMTFAVWPLMPLVWYDWWLKDLPTAKNGQSIDDLLDSDLLGVLPTHVSPQQVAELSMRQTGGIFFALRFGVGPGFVGQLSSQNTADTAALWQNVMRLRQELKMHKITVPLVVAALVRTIPGNDRLLAQLQLRFEDVLAGVRWFDHLTNLANTMRKRQSSGGIGRDLSFGFTPTLSRFAHNVSLQAAQGTLAREISGHRKILEQLVSQLSNSGRRNAVLVGRPGVGKTTLVWAMAEKLMRGDANVPHELRFCQVMELDPSALIGSAGGRGELESLVNSLLNEAYRAKNIILFLDNAELFFSNETGSVDLRNILLPVLENGAVRLVLGMDEQQFLKLSRATPSLAQQLNRIMVAPTDEVDTLLACEEQVMQLEYRFRVTYMYQALKTAYRLGQRYVADQAMPGQALKLLEVASQFSESGLVTSASVEKAVEKTYGVKVANAHHADERDMLLNLENLLHRRMVNQTRAVNVVANALRRARSGVRNQNRPIGSFLFLGPTGVGKTELAKALAAVFFGGEDHMVRVDLNQYGQESDVHRLIADAAQDSDGLTSRIAKQPYSVVLLDEIEKAHPKVQDALLQLLDEGVLRDVNNREVSFRDAIVIATSNAGADKIRQYISSGQKVEDFEDKFIDELIDSGQFKPEFLNRFDEAIVFRPLTADELLQVVDLMLVGVNKVLAQQNVAVVVADDAKRKLVEAGNDPRLGARPLRRVVQRTVENIVAKHLLQGQVAPGQEVTISLAEVNEALQK